MVIRRKLAAFDAAQKPEDLAIGGNRLDRLTHTKPGYYSIRINNHIPV
jgi:plasmid maintenance system killer protein